MRTALYALLLTALLATAAAQAASDARTVLSNGLVIIAVEDRSSAVAAFHLAVRFDPAAIPAERAGVAALSQQALQVAMKQRLTEAPYVNLSEALRGTRAALVLNTEMDYAEVRAQLPASELTSALRLSGILMFGTPQTGAEDLAVAKGILSNAIDDTAENVVEATYYRFLRAFFGNKSALARPAEGTNDSLGTLSADDLAAYRATCMGPNNASVCVTGPYPVAELTQMAREAFAQYTAATSTCPKAVAPPLPAESKVSVAQLAKWRGSSVMVGVGTPPYGTDGFLQAQLIYTLLEGEQGRLAHDEELSGGFGLNRLMNRREDAPSVTVLAPMAMPRPLLIAHMMTAPRLMEPVREALLTHFLSFTTRPPAPEELTVAKQRLTNAYAMMQLSRLNLAKAVNCYEVYGQDYRRLWNTEKAIEAIKAEDLARLTREHFQTHAIGLLLPGDEE